MRRRGRNLRIDQRGHAEPPYVLFWDFDGTLAYSPHLWSEAMCEAVNEAAGTDLICLEEVRPHMRVGFPWHTPEAAYPEDVNDRWWTMLYRRIIAVGLRLGLTPAQAEAVCPLLRARILDRQRYHLYPDTRSVLRWTVTHHYRNILVSNNYPELPEMMACLGLASFFQEMVVSARLGYEKPHPIIFQRALAAAGRLHRPDTCVMIGDNPIADIEGGRRAGMKTVLVHHAGAAGPQADASISALAELPACLQAWEKE